MKAREVKEVLAWGIVFKNGEDFWCISDGHHKGRMSIYDTRKNALKDKGAGDKIIRVKILKVNKGKG